MKKLAKFLPMLLIGATVTSSWVIEFSESDYSVIWDKMINLWSSFLNIVLWYLPYLLVFWVVIGIGAWIVHKLTSR